MFQIPGDPPPGRIDQQVDRIVLDVLRQPVLDGEDQRWQPADGKALRQALRIGLDRRRGLPVEQAGGRPPEEDRQRRRADREQQGVDRREAEAGRTQQTPGGNAGRAGEWTPEDRGRRHALSARSM
jgi:hypothetical protein